MIVTIIGVSALLLARAEQRAVRMTEQAVQADCGAQSMVDVTIFRLSNSANWRTTFVNDAWTPAEIVGDVTFRCKLVDDTDGDLADDANDPVRLYAKATVGEAVRIYSVQLAPVGPVNLLSNPAMEDGTADWLAWYCDMESRTDQVHGGIRCLHVYNRIGYNSSSYQTLKSGLQKGATYQFRVWVKMDAGTSNVLLDIETEGSSSGTAYFDSQPVSVGTTWTEVTANLTPSWSGELLGALVSVYTASGNTGFGIDDAALVDLVASQQLTVVPGTWRREVLP
jgi:hypothetical protein